MDQERDHEGNHKNILRRIAELDNRLKLNGGGIAPVQNLVGKQPQPQISRTVESREHKNTGEDGAGRVDSGCLIYEHKRTDFYTVESSLDNTSESANIADLASNEEETCSQHVIDEHKSPTNTTAAKKGKQNKPVVKCWNITDNIIVIDKKELRKKSTLKSLGQSHGRKYLIYTFGESQDPSMEGNCQYYPGLTFSVPLFIEIAHTSKTWLTVYEDGLVIIELDSQIREAVLTLLCVIAAYHRVYSSAEHSYFWIRKLLPDMLSASETVLRYCRYFDQVTDSSCRNKCARLLLNQIIITAAPNSLFYGSVPIRLRLVNGTQEHVVCENCYHDSNFIIFSNIDICITGDTEIGLETERDGRTVNIFTICLNSYFYRHGLYRFSLAEAHSGGGRRELFISGPEDLILDIIFIEDTERTERCLLSTQQNMIQDLKRLSDRAARGADDSTAKKSAVREYLLSGCDGILAEFFVSMGISIQESKGIIQKLESAGIRQVMHHSSPVRLQKPDEVVERSKQIASPISARPFLDQLPRSTPRPVYSVHGVEDVPLITEVQINKPSVSRGGGLRTLIKKKEELLDQEVHPTMRADPLHWSVISDIKDTIFSDIREIPVEVDLAQLEAQFCEAVTACRTPRGARREQKTVLDCRRVFLASLALKHLEMRNLQIANIQSTLKQNSDTLLLEDLINLDRCLPTEEEHRILEEAEYSTLSSVERSMLVLAQNAGIRALLSLMIFERKFNEEAPLILGTLEKVLEALERILSSNELKSILKIILLIGNAINCRYSPIKRRKAEGYRLDSLKMVCSYIGRGKQDMTRFIRKCMQDNGIQASKLFDDMSLIYDIQGEELPRIKQKLNEFIAQYQEFCKSSQGWKMDFRQQHAGFLGHVCKTLIDGSQMYRECNIQGSLLNRKFGEPPTKQFNDTVSILAEFITRLKLENHN